MTKMTGFIVDDQIQRGSFEVLLTSDIKGGGEGGVGCGLGRSRRSIQRRG